MPPAPSNQRECPNLLLQLMNWMKCFWAYAFVWGIDRKGYIRERGHNGRHHRGWRRGGVYAAGRGGDGKIDIVVGVRRDGAYTRMIDEG